MKTSLAFVLGIAVGAAAAGAVFTAKEHARPIVAPLSAPPVPETPRPIASVTRTKSVPVPAPAVPITPTYRVPVAPQAIYRCKGRSGTRYSNEPCAGGTVVDESSAVSGYDTRPSDRLARLVAEGRGVDAPSQPVYRATPRSDESGDCAAMRRQILDLDATMRQPNDARRLDELRATRQDVRTGMARLHC